MKKTSESLLLIMLLSMLMALILPATTLANSAEPPSVVILVSNPPRDISIVLLSNENQPVARVRQVAWEGYYVFYSRDMQTNSEYKFRVTTNGESFECTINKPLQHYNNVFTLDIPGRKLTPGTYPFRRALIISIRLLLTLLFEGIIFWIFGYREKISWIIFLCTNLVTQGALNICLNSEGSLMPSYLIISLIIGEFFVFATEMIVFPVLIKEHTKRRSLIYAFIANFISLIAGGYFISVLPV